MMRIRTKRGQNECEQEAFNETLKPVFKAWSETPGVTVDPPASMVCSPLLAAGRRLLLTADGY